ncbi:hypothetical protein IW262DRAFT_1385268 [Armillaria fumosa]|nr:hypothetical protein IW262DRAFT_1385268 [Armillaria fumosa]
MTTEAIAFLVLYRIAAAIQADTIWRPWSVFVISPVIRRKVDPMDGGVVDAQIGSDRIKRNSERTSKVRPEELVEYTKPLVLRAKSSDMVSLIL